MPRTAHLVFEREKVVFTQPLRMIFGMPPEPAVCSLNPNTLYRKSHLYTRNRFPHAIMNFTDFFVVFLLLGSIVAAQPDLATNPVFKRGATVDWLNDHEYKNQPKLREKYEKSKTPRSHLFPIHVHLCMG